MVTPPGSSANARARSPVIGILALSRIADDPRARRQGDAFSSAGWQVVGIGLGGSASPPPVWPIWHAANGNTKIADLPGSSDRAQLRRRLRYFAPGRIRNGTDLLAVRLGASRARRAYWRLYPAARDIYRMASRINADFWLANDWTMLPVARRLASESGAAFGYDSHELATEEFADQVRWRFWRQPLVRAVERCSIGDAAVISAVSEGIALRLRELYPLAQPPVVIRNTPAFESISFRPAAAPARVIYHGILAPGRGLEAAIDSVAAWRPEFDLTLRGPGHPTFLQALQRRIASRRLEARVLLAPPVPMTALVREAAAFDIGLFALPRSSRHNELALPNKIFEYIMAGLAICVTELPEMAQLVRRYNLGVTIPRLAPDAIAETINRLDPRNIDHYKRNALAAARELCWERESARLVAAYDAALRQTAN